MTGDIADVDAKIDGLQLTLLLNQHNGFSDRWEKRAIARYAHRQRHFMPTEVVLSKPGQFRDEARMDVCCTQSKWLDAEFGVAPKI